MNFELRVHMALRSTHPETTLRSMVDELASQGCDKSQILSLLENSLVKHQMCADFREEDEEIMLDILDGLTNWCLRSSATVRGVNEQG